MCLKTTLLAAGSALILSAGAAAAVPAVAESAVHLRAGPGTEHPVLTTIPGGARVDVGGCTGSWCRVNYAGEAGYASRRYLAMAGEVAPSGAVAVVPGEVYDDAPLYADDYFDYGYTYGPGLSFYVSPRHRFHQRGHRHGNWNNRVGTWQGRPGWTGARTGSGQASGRTIGIQSGNVPSGLGRSAIGGRPSVSAPVGMPSGGGAAVFRGGAGAAGAVQAGRGGQAGGGAVGVFRGGAGAGVGRGSGR